MRIYTNVFDAVRETEREIWELGINVHPQTMQNKDVHDDPEYMTREIRGYAFKVVDCAWKAIEEQRTVAYAMTGKTDMTDSVTEAVNYIDTEFADRVNGTPQNPGRSYKHREGLWNEFRDRKTGKFHYTYSERIAPQIFRIIKELQTHPDTRQAIINVHSNICAVYPPLDTREPNMVVASQDLELMGGVGRIPCSMYYQLMIREGKLDLIYTMRSCDFITHFAVDISLAIRIQNHIAGILKIPPGAFTYFTGSLHAYIKDLKTRGIF